MPADVAANVNRHVAFGAFRYVVRTPGTDLVTGMTLPKKAPAVSIVPVRNGFIIASGLNATEEGRAQMIARIQAKHGKGEKDVPPPPEPNKSRGGSAG